MILVIISFFIAELSAKLIQQIENSKLKKWNKLRISINKHTFKHL